MSRRSAPVAGKPRGTQRQAKRGSAQVSSGLTGPGRSATELVRVALDEFNLATFPISVLDKKAQSSREPLLFRDTILWNGERVDRMWKVFPHPEKGFPGPIDDDVMMALLELTREQGGAKKVFFSRYDLLKRLGWPINATYYTRLETSFRKLAAVRVEAINAFGDRTRKRFVNMGLTFIQEWKLNSETRGGEKSSYVLWSDRIAESIHQELTRYLDATFYFEELSSAIERRLFRYLDNYFEGKSASMSLNVRDLSHEHLGISRQYKYISQIMQRLEPALNTLVDKGYLESWLLSGESLYLNKKLDFGSRVQLALPFLSAVRARRRGGGRRHRLAGAAPRRTRCGSGGCGTALRGRFRRAANPYRACNSVSRRRGGARKAVCESGGLPRESRRQGRPLYRGRSVDANGSAFVVGEIDGVRPRPEGEA